VWIRIEPGPHNFGLSVWISADRDPNPRSYLDSARWRLGIPWTAIDTLKEIAGAKTPVRTTQMLPEMPDAEVRVS